MIYGIIDLGTNTFKLLIVNVSDDGRLLRQHEREMGVKLGEGGVGKKEIASQAFDRGIHSLGELISEARQYLAGEIIIVGTSGIRSARNGKAFIEKIREMYNAKVKVVSGEEEAELIYRGVRQAVKLTEKPVLILDIGGGSNEFILADQQNYRWKHSYDLGIARLLDRFKPSDPISEDEVKRVYQYLESELETLFDHLEGYHLDTLIGCAGTFETYRSILEARDQTSERRIDKRSPVFEISIDDLHELYEMLVFAPFNERKKIPGLPLFRVEMIVLATIFVNFIVEKFQIKHIIQSDYALKEGALDQFINQ